MACVPTKELLRCEAEMISGKSCGNQSMQFYVIQPLGKGPWSEAQMLCHDCVRVFQEQGDKVLAV